MRLWLSVAQSHSKIVKKWLLCEASKQLYSQPQLAKLISLSNFEKKLIEEPTISICISKQILKKAIGLACVQISPETTKILSGQCRTECGQKLLQREILQSINIRFLHVNYVFWFYMQTIVTILFYILFIFDTFLRIFY